ncbi:MAG: signal transduction histidine kinase/ActR/RegA family two-component response regulator [Methylophilaceae bacterium]|jgi:signal transduction histidine kinase/ActR/RegA family two-component response regulator|tara:strand:+ start:34596 stop:36560 length:1965 start_codon:yes stop_codon:yes gene_type:complete
MHEATKTKPRVAQYWQDLPLATKGVFVIMLPLAVLLASLASLYSLEKKLSSLENQLKVALQNQRDIETVHTNLLLASTGVRDYLLTGDKHFLDNFYIAKKQLPTILLKLDTKLESQGQRSLIKQIGALANQNLEKLSFLSNNESEVASDNLIQQFKLQVQNMEELKEQIDRLQQQEAQLISEDQHKIKQERQRNIRINLIAAFSGILGSILAVWIFSGTIVKRVKLLRDSAAHLARAEALELPSSSKDELGQLSDELDHASTLLAKNIYDTTQAKKEAEQASEEKSMFLSRTSHELRTPLNAILGFAQLLQAELENGKHKDQVNMIKSAGDHLLKLIDEVLDIAKIESGETKLTLKPTPINDLLAEAIQYIAPLGKIRDIQIKEEIQVNLVGLADRQKLLQVILNLLSNALKYGPFNSSVLVSAYQKNTDIIIEVLDEGAGIPEALKERLFTAFDRLGAEQSKTEGTGLGLAVSKQIMLAMHGSIHVANEKSLFWIALKASEGLPIQIESVQETAVTIQTVSTTDKKHIVYVEDNISNRALVEAVIKRLPNVKLHCTTTVKESKDLLNQIKANLVIVDLNLPGESGEVLVNYIKSHQTLSHLPIMILSADATAETIERLNQAGVDDYMTKPLNIALFSESVLTLTQGDRNKHDR